MPQRTIKNIKKIAKDYVNFLQEGGLSIKQAFVFGSYAKNKANKHSDIDLCIVSPKFKDFLEAMQFLFKKRRDVDVMSGIEPVGYNPKDFAEDENPLVWEIKKTGINIL